MLLGGFLRAPGVVRAGRCKLQCQCGYGLKGSGVVVVHVILRKQCGMWDEMITVVIKATLFSFSSSCFYIPDTHVGRSEITVYILRTLSSAPSADLLDRDSLPMGLGGDYHDVSLPRGPNHCPPR